MLTCTVGQGVTIDPGLLSVGVDTLFLLRRCGRGGLFIRQRAHARRSRTVTIHGGRVVLENVRGVSRRDRTLVKALIDCIGLGVADGTPIYPLLCGCQAELVRGIEVEDIGVVVENVGVFLLVEKRWHFEAVNIFEEDW